MPFLLVFRSDTAASLTRQGEVAFREQFIAVNDRPGGLQGEGYKPRKMSHGVEQGDAVFKDGMPCSCLFQQRKHTICPQILQ